MVLNYILVGCPWSMHPRKASTNLVERAAFLICRQTFPNQNVRPMYIFFPVRYLPDRTWVNQFPDLELLTQRHVRKYFMLGHNLVAKQGRRRRRRRQWDVGEKKWICVLSNLIASIWARSICQVQATFPGVKLRILFRFKKRKENSSS